MKKLSFFLTVILLLINNSLLAKTPKVLRVGMVTDVGGVNDQSFNQSAWEGLQKAKTELGVKVSYLESKQDADYPSNLETMYDSENNLIWGIGFKMADAVRLSARQNPEQKYAIIDYSYGDKTPKNLVAIKFKAEQGAFLAGYISAKMSKSGVIGFVGGMNVPIINDFQYGYKAGAKYANPKIQVLDQFAESFSDAAKGKAIANQMFAKKVDVVFHAAGGVGDGVIEAAKEKNKYAVGVDRDQNYMAPNNVITSSLKRVDRAIYQVVEELKKGKFAGGTTIELGLESGAVDIAETTDKLIPIIILEKVKEIKSDIIAKKIKVPTTAQEYAAFEKVLK